MVSCILLQQLYIINKMSKLRDTIYKSNIKRSRSRNCETLQKQGRQTLMMQSKWADSKLFDSIKCHTEANDGPQQQKDHTYNRNITHYRDAFKLNDSNMLPFLSSLRHIKNYKNQKSIQPTVLQPFQVSMKETVNQKTKKNINDMSANPFRLSKAYYRWHNRSGAGVRIDCQFECMLRLNKNTKNPEDYSFKNNIKPLRYRTVQECKYDPKVLICQRQRKIFSLTE